MRNARNPLTRSLQVLRHLVQSPTDSVGVRTIALALKMAPSTMHRVLSSLVEEGLVSRRVDGTYALGLEMVRLSYLAVERLPIQKLAIPHLRQLVSVTNETALLGLYDRARQEMMFVASAESSQPLRYVNKMRTWMPVYAGASGLSIMAFLPDSEREQIIERTHLAPLTNHTVTERYKLDDLLEQVRQTGYSCTIGQRTPGAVAVGAPVFGPSGDVAGDIIITLPEQRFDRSSEPHLAAHVMRCAQAVTREFGGVPPFDFPGVKDHRVGIAVAAAETRKNRAAGVSPRVSRR